jgi:hypothetical protein
MQHAKWESTIVLVYGWGDKGRTQKATAGWLAALRVFKPHWQICMAAGLSTGTSNFLDKILSFMTTIIYVPSGSLLLVVGYIF